MVVPIISYHINIWVSPIASHLNDQKLPKVSTTVLYLETNHHNHRYNTIIIPYHYPTTYRISRFYNPTYLHGAIIPEKVFEPPPASYDMWLFTSTTIPKHCHMLHYSLLSHLPPYSHTLVIYFESYVIIAYRDEYVMVMDVGLSMEP